MRKITVDYYLDEENEQRLKKITEAYKKEWPEATEEKVFVMIMRTGCKFDIEEKFKFHEWKLGLREFYK